MGTAVARTIVALVLLAAIAGPVFAEEAPPDDPAVQDRIQKKKEAEALDKQYKATLKNTDQTTTPVRSDPWQNMRGAADSKTKR
jgi:hypothetical protein